jgi:hypothetical protein
MLSGVSANKKKKVERDIEKSVVVRKYIRNIIRIILQYLYLYIYIYIYAHIYIYIYAQTLAAGTNTGFIIFLFASYVIFSGKWPPLVRLNGHRPPLVAAAAAATTTSSATDKVAAAGGIQYLREVGVPPVTLSLTTYIRSIYTPITCAAAVAVVAATDLPTNANVEINRFLSIFLVT